MSLPASHNLTAYVGDDFARTIRIAASEGDFYDFTGCDVLAQVRAYAGADDVLATIGASVDGDGHIALAADADATADWVGLRGVWDLQVTWPGGDVVTYLAGQFRPTTDVSRSVGP